MNRLKLMTITGIMIFSVMIPVGATVSETNSTGAAFELGIIHPHTSTFFDYVISDFTTWFAEQNPGDTITVTPYTQSSLFGADIVLNWNGTAPEADILWGGGKFVFELLVNNPGLNLLQNYTSPEDANFKEVFGGWNLKEDGGGTPAWYAAAISGFGFMYNTEYLTANNLPVPTTWDDLTKFEYFGHIVMADPSKSGSTTASVLQMLQYKSDANGQSTITSDANITEAWQFWAKLAGNVGEFTSSSSTVPTKVSEGEYGIGLVIDYFGLDAVAAGRPVEFTFGDATTVSPDPVGIIKNTANLPQAEAFMEYITSTRGQSKVGKFRTPANFKAVPPSDSIVKAAFDSSGNPLTTNYPVIEPFSQSFDGRMFSRSRLLFTSWFVENTAKQTAAWESINGATGAAYDEALATYLKLPSDFNGTIGAMYSLNKGNSGTWQSEGATNFDAAVEGLPAASTPGFEIFALLLVLIPAVIYRKRK